MNESDKLLFGKDETKNLVSVEIKDNLATLFIENEGIISKETRQNRWWILYNSPAKERSKLSGNLHYKYGDQFSNKKNWLNEVLKSRKNKIDFFTIWDEKEQFLVKDGLTYFKGLKHTDPSILSFDIESTGLFHNSDSKVLLISNTFRKNDELTRKLFAYDDYDSQSEMIDDWCRWVRSVDPSIICGHNIYTFDLPYLNFIAKQDGTALDLGRDGSEASISPKASKFRIDGSRDQEYHKVRIYGRECIDTMFLAIKHDIATKKYESYGLKSIIKAEGLEKTDRVHYDSSQIRFNYTNTEEWTKIKEYCIHDSDDALAVYDLAGPASFYLTQSVPKSFQAVVESATGSQINAMMIRSYLQEGHSIPKTSPTVPFKGAISRGLPGVYKNCVRWDVAGMYPSIMLQYNVYDEEKDPRGNFLKILKRLTEDRLRDKKLAKETGDPYYDGLQNSKKILCNSAYGFMGAPGLNYNFPRGADFVTRRGREILKVAIEWATSRGADEWEKQFNE